jgi:integrase
MAVHLDRVDFRGKLKPRRTPYWQRLTAGRYLGFRHLSARSCGNWLARLYDGQKKYLQCPLGDFDNLPEKQRFDAAKKAAEEWFSHLDLGGSTAAATVKDACEAYVDNLKIENSEAASLDAAGRFRRLVYDDPIAGVDLSRLTATQVAGWKKRVLAKGGSRSSYNRNATAVRAALNLAVKRRAVSSDHAWIDELAPFEDADGRRELYLTLPNRRKLIAKTQDEAQALIRAFALLPLRPGDVAALKVADFDARHAVLTVPKGKTKARKIPLSGEILVHVKACAKSKRPEDFLFCRADGRQWKREGWRDAINDAAKAAKLPKETCAYSFRHSAITDLVTSGLDLFHVAQLSGTSVVMIEKNYGHLQRKQVREGLQVLGLK